MADEDEVDVLGDFCLNLDTELNNYDAGEFPSHGAGLLGDYMQHPWLMDHSQAWYFDHSTDEKNKASLDVMLEDEKKHFPAPPLVVSSPEPVPSHSSSPLTTSMSTPPKVSPLWTPADISLLKDGIKQYGQDWSKIARKIGSKTTLQVKSYVKIHPELVTSASRPSSRPGSRAPSPPNFVNEVEIDDRVAGSSYSSLILLDEAQIPASIEEVIASITTGQPTVTKQKSKERVKASQGKSAKKPPPLSPASKKKPKKKPLNEVESSKGYGTHPSSSPSPKNEPEALVAPPLPKLEGEIIRIKKTSECNRSESEEEVDIEDEETPVPKTSLVKSEDVVTTVEPPAEEEAEAENVVEQSSLDVPELRESSVVDSSEESQPVFYFPAPKESRDIDPVTVTEEEKRVHWDFFEGKSSKTPERYIKIRNIIVQEWKRIRPRYLTKTSVRQYLKNCGDVNCISRIHAYLELTGVINFGCDKVSYDKPLPPVPSLRERFIPCPEKRLVASLDLPPARIRKKRQFSEDDKDGGYTIQHDADGNQVIVRKKAEAAPKVRKPKKIKSPSEDPFQLVPYVSFDSEFTAPFEVQVSAQALVVIDVHAHLCTTEVIGLLGGHLYTTNTVPVLCIQAAQPCRSLSTGHQCEMCPVSQTEESERLRASGLEVVGWYHSHPTFPARPSLRDVHTQQNFQTWFSKQEIPFTGVIINPYCSSKSGGPASMIRCMTVHDGLPYKHELHFTSSFYDPVKIEQILSALVRDLVHCPTLVPLGSSYPHACGAGDADTKITYGTKVLSSLKNHLKEVLSSEDIESLCALVKERVTKVLSVKELA